jgi:formyltetrahydrofolate hydrolase
MSKPIRITFESGDTAGVIAFMTAFLSDEGFDVRKRELHEKETPSEFAARMGIHITSLPRTLRNADCPKDFEARYGGTGRRMIWLRASAALEEFIRDNKRAAGSSKRTGRK